MKLRQLRRIDPENCGCTDCHIGYSRPVDAATGAELYAMLNGELVNATGLEEDDFEVEVTVRRK